MVWLEVKGERIIGYIIISCVQRNFHKRALRLYEIILKRRLPPLPHPPPLISTIAEKTKSGYFNQESIHNCLDELISYKP